MAKLHTNKVISSFELDHISTTYISDRFHLTGTDHRVPGTAAHKIPPTKSDMLRRTRSK